MAQSGSGAELVPAAIVVPIVDEARTLPRLLAGIANQSQRPAELVFVDGGSRDNSITMIEAWWREHGWTAGNCNVIVNPGGLPGGNRNAGIRHSAQPWIAFLDGGIEPAPDWLEQLFRQAQNTPARAISGVCQFEGEGPVKRAVCALSAGVGITHPVLPASLFRREIFSAAGYFRDDLRSAEDLEWLGRLARAGVERQICKTAKVTYRHFPETGIAAIRKWFLYETNTSRAGVRGLQQCAYLIAFSALLLATFVSISFALATFTTYWFARGIIDPARRSRNLCWWRGEPRAFFYAAILGPCLDLAKLAGILASLHLRGKRN